MLLESILSSNSSDVDQIENVDRSDRSITIQIIDQLTVQT